MPKEGETKLRYPGNDPENGRAFMHVWKQGKWECAHTEWESDPEDSKLELCVHCQVWRKKK